MTKPYTPTHSATAHALRRLPTFNTHMSQAIKIDPDAGRMSTTSHDITATAPVTLQRKALKTAR